MMARYEVHPINTSGPESGLGGLHPDLVGSSNSRDEAESIAACESSSYGLGCAVVDTVGLTIDWGTHPETGEPVVTDFHGN